MLANRLDKAWRTRRASGAVDVAMRFTDAGLVLGAGTVLAASGATARDIAIDPHEPRLCALLIAAHLRRPAPRELAHLSKAVRSWREGQDDLAAMHLALSQLDRLQDPATDAHRLFLADGLLASGVAPTAIINAIQSQGPVLEQLQKYDPNQPRVPAGSGRTSGEWTSDGSAVGDAQSAANDNSAQQADGSQPEVNPSTVTDTAYYDACGHATSECITAAFEANAEDIENDNDDGLNADIKKCRDADKACNLLSIAIEDVPLLDHGGVIFPHRGVVLIDKGKQDRYIPPLPGGRRPYFKRSL